MYAKNSDVSTHALEKEKVFSSTGSIIWKPKPPVPFPFAAG